MLSTTAYAWTKQEYSFLEISITSFVIDLVDRNEFLAIGELRVVGEDEHSQHLHEIVLIEAVGGWFGRDYV